MHSDLREWIEEAERIGKLVRISGAHWEKEMAALIDLVKIVHQKMQGLTPIPVEKVDGGPVMENIHQGKEVNLLDLPVPLFSRERASCMETGGH